MPPESAYFLSVNRNKRSITVDFKSPVGLEILHRMIKQSDVLVENFISGKLATFGLGWDDCRKINPRLIYASITGKNDVATSPAFASLTPALKGMVRRGHTEGLLDTMSSSKAKVRQHVHSESAHDCSPSLISGINAHVRAANTYYALP